MNRASVLRKAKILIVDDQKANILLLERMLGNAGYTSVTATTKSREVCELHRTNRYDLILLDLAMPGMDGFEVMEGLKALETDGYVPVLVITAQPEHKLRALEAGAKDFVSKPLDLAEVTMRVHNMLEVRMLQKDLKCSNVELERRVAERTVKLQTALSEIRAMKERLEAENIYFRQEIRSRDLFGNIIGESDSLKSVLHQVEQVAPTNATVLILGETGTGKELIATAIHDMSPRKERPLITVNCAALPGNLIESELFGHEKGAFTGADKRQVGRFELANGSTLCLDEIGELPLELQAKLLRVIQYNKFERLGSSQTISIDVRILATTNRDLAEEVRKGRFRQDLYYRLNVFPITVPPLRQRPGDIPLLVEAMIERYGRKLGRSITTIQKETMRAMQEYAWPGNVRELESIVERAMILCPGPVFQLADKLERLEQSGQLERFGQSGQLDRSPLPSPGLMTLEERERNQILQTLANCRWRINGAGGAAEILGINPSTLRARMIKLGIRRPAPGALA